MASLTRPGVLASASTLVLSCVLLVAAPGVARAVPPPNDSIFSATPIEAVPATFRQDARSATFDPATDPDVCISGASIWYRIQPARPQTLRFSTVGSDYDTVLGVYTGQPGALTNVACSDDAVAVASAVEVNLTAGTTFWVAVMACCGTTATGGHAVLHVWRPRPLRFSVAMSAAEAGLVSGRAFIRGTSSCSTPALTQVSATVSQRVGRFVARGTGASPVLRCGEWSVAIDSETDIAFRARPAVVTVEAAAGDGFAFETLSMERTVTLSGVIGGHSTGPSRRGAGLLARPPKP